MARLNRCAWVLIGLASVGCALVQPSAEPQACPAALLEGTLVRDDDAGLTVLVEEVGVAFQVEWPAGWTIRDVDGEWQLVNGAGQVVGSEGDELSAGGGYTSGPVEVFQPCGEITVTPGP